METQRNTSSFFKHMDFIILDAILLELSYFLATWIYSKQAYVAAPFGSVEYRQQAISLLGALIISLSIERPYNDILKRTKWMEMVKMLQHTLFLALVNMVILFAIHNIAVASRMITGYMWIIYTVTDYVARVVWKKVIRRYVTGHKAANRQIILCTSRDQAQAAVSGILSKEFTDYDVAAVFLEDFDELTDLGKEIEEVPVMGSCEDMMNYVTHNWVDEVVLNLPEQSEKNDMYRERLESMGIEVHTVLFNLFNARNIVTPYVGELGSLVVVTNQKRDIPMYQWFLKKLLDIIGGIVGCLLTCLIFIFVAPAIYLKSPGPIFFAQDRVGRNGKVFKMYKFRSMYMDAEERKKELMKLNKVEDGMMFKLDDDPRIIGSEKKDKNGRPKGIGNFIRNTSLDEFPQFFNVLKGDMSLVGTRPPTLDEWEKYSEHHRKRLSMRPGITGLWQISGRSDITDFEKVVALDSQYIDTWTVAMDITIILRTIGKVLKREGAE